jgi:transcriptional regulator with XRE-family HTH domain
MRHPKTSLLYYIVGRNIRKHREEKGITQEELAEKVSLGRTSITNIEAGKQRTALDELYNIALTLDVAITDLLPPVQDYLMKSVEDAVADAIELLMEQLDRFADGKVGEQ